MRLLSLIFIFCCLFSVSFADDDAPLVKRESLVPVAPAKVVRYATAIIQRYDTNSDSVLQREEWGAMPGTPQAIDVDGDGQITLSELIWYFAQYGRGKTIHRSVAMNLSEPYQFDPSNLKLLSPVVQQPTAAMSGTSPQEDVTDVLLQANDQPIDDDAYQKLLESKQVPSSRPYHVLPGKLRGVPAWFILRDRDGDGQISMREFAPALSPESVKMFKQLDKNGDGFIEPDEARR